MARPSPPSARFRRALRARRVRGTTSIEMVMVFPLMIAAWFGLTQLGLVVIGKFVVQHAAHRAARAAVVVLDDDPKEYGADGLKRNRLEGEDDPRFVAIKRAASAPLTVLAPSEEALNFEKLLNREVPVSSTFRDSITSGLGQALLGVVGYNGVSVVLSITNESESDQFGLKDPVTARIDYLFPCRVPFGALLICKSYKDLMSDDETKEILERVENPNLQKLLEVTPFRFLVLSAEETLPNQGADYHGKYE